MTSRYDYVAYDETAMKHQAWFKEHFQTFEKILLENFGESHYRQLAIDHSEITYMMIGKLIRDEQIKRNGSAPLQEGRGNE